MLVSSEFFGFGISGVVFCPHFPENIFAAVRAFQALVVCLCFSSGLIIMSIEIL